MNSPKIKIEAFSFSTGPDVTDYWRCCENLIEGVDSLLVGAQESKAAAVYLKIVIEQGLRGLHALAANGREPAATLLIKWAEIAWQILLEVTGNKPQEHPDLLALGKSAESKRPKYCKTLHPATKAANVKAKIKSRLFEAFETIAGDSNSSPGI